jgi:DNA-binding MarR family transcriptional regulator
MTSAERSDDTATELAVLLGQLIRMLRRNAPTDVGPGSLAAMATLFRSGSMRVGDLAAREGLAPPTLTRMVAGMESAGYVLRSPDPVDRRAVQVALTPAGARMVQQALAGRAAVLRSRLQQLPDADLRALAQAMPALRTLCDDGA